MAARIRIRMYRTGFGDCFLLSFGPAKTAKHVLIDFGAHMHGEIGTMEQVMDNIELVTQKKLAVIVASHAHRDHISGFGKFAHRFRKFEIGEVWMPWTDNPKDKKASALQKRQNALYDRLHNHLAAAGANGNDACRGAAVNALDNLRGNALALASLHDAFETDAPAKYLRAGDVLRKAGGIAGLSAQILSPPNDVEFFSRMNPPAHQRYLDAANAEQSEIHPFPHLEVKPGEPEYAHLLALLPESELKKLQDSADAPASRLALVLDNARNNTSLVILFRFEGRSLLFPGDAQWGNWQSWIDTDDARTLLESVDFLKIAHHGSHNATPVSVVQALRKSNVVAMMATQITPYPTIPRMELVDELQKHCSTVVVRSDWVAVEDAPVGPEPMPKLPRGTKPGALWIDYVLNAGNGESKGA
jgi:hypothetical protein